MSRRCQVTGKRPNSANNVSFSQKKTKRKQYPNIQKRKIWIPEENRYVTLKVSTQALRTIDKVGLIPYLRKRGLSLSEIMNA